MFISKDEKDLILHKIASLELSVANVYTALRLLEEKIPKPAQKTAFQKKKQAEYMRKYTARKRAEKKAQLAQAVA
jgi:predicted transcriptional regulator YheO